MIWALRKQYEEFKAQVLLLLQPSEEIFWKVHFLVQREFAKEVVWLIVVSILWLTFLGTYFALVCTHGIWKLKSLGGDCCVNWYTSERTTIQSGSLTWNISHSSNALFVSGTPFCLIFLELSYINIVPSFLRFLLWCFNPMVRVTHIFLKLIQL